jgi:uncharacterized damage-inducible protein DinB
MPSWLPLIIGQDELDLTPPPGQGQYRQPPTSELVATLDKQVTNARDVLSKTTDEFLLTTRWRLKAGGQIVADDPRHIVIRDTINHWSHHRGQLTVYLRLLERTVPSIYGPSADDSRFL